MTLNWKRTVLAAAAMLMAAPLAANAADLRRPYYKGQPALMPAYYNWAGFYVGVNAGYGWGQSHWTSPLVDINPKGGMFGATVGYNYQLGAFVFGLEGDFDWSMMKGSNACGVAATCETKNTWLGTGRGRVGYAFDRFLPYVTGGVAFGDIKASMTNPLGTTSASATKLGWVLGVGLEYAFSTNWTVKGEYLRADLGNFECGAPCSGVAGVPSSVSFKADMVRLGVNYKFGGPLISRF